MVDTCIYEKIISGMIMYDENMPDSFKNKYPDLFLGENVFDDIKKRFYGRKLTFRDFEETPELIRYFNKTNVACGFSLEYAWMIELFKDKSIVVGNLMKLEILKECEKISSRALREEFKGYLLNNIYSLDKINLEEFVAILTSLVFSNSSELCKFRVPLIEQLLKVDNRVESLKKIEDIYLRNNIPMVGKIFSTFEILHPDCSGFNFSTYSMISPVLKNSSMLGRKVIIFADLIKASFGSNNRSVRDYLNNLELGYNLFQRVSSGEVGYENLSDDNKKELRIFCNHLVTLYDNTLQGKNNGMTLSGDVIRDIGNLRNLFSHDGKIDADLVDRIVKMFCHFAGIDTLEEARSYFETKVRKADMRNRKFVSDGVITLEEGDFIKGIGDIKYLGIILQNGSVAKEFLGEDATSDCTPLDTDLARVLLGGSIDLVLSNSVASSYGPIWFVLKNDERFKVTRELAGDVSNDSKVTNDGGKLEVFCTLRDEQFGIRTGFASSEIDYIIVEHDDPRVGLEIAMNGFYIPVVDKFSGEIIFSPEDYDKLREKMSGLRFYDMGKYRFARDDELISSRVLELVSQIDGNLLEVYRKKLFINRTIAKVLLEMGLKLKDVSDGDLTEGFVEFIDIGATGRGTNKYGDNKFDFIMKLDRRLLLNETRVEEFRKRLLKALGKDVLEERDLITVSGDLDLKKVEIGGLKESVDIAINFGRRTDKVVYSTDECLKDRLKVIKSQDPFRYKLVIANIIFAKEFLNDAGVLQGGLGEVGIENWILQNGGSFERAAREFLKVANYRSFEFFKNNYLVWDFGENHISESQGLYLHDNFIERNMNALGYEKMRVVLNNYVNGLDNRQVFDRERVSR